MTTLYEEIVAKCTSQEIAEKNYHHIAAVVNVNRKVPNSREVGNGTVLEVLGLTVGNALLDVVYNTPSYRYVKPLLEQGRLILSSNLVQNTLSALVGQTIAAGVTFTQANKDALDALAFDEAKVSWMQCQDAVEAGV